MILNKKVLRLVLNVERSKGYILGVMLKNFSITKLNIDNRFFQTKFNLSTQIQKLNIELNLNDLNENKLQFNLIDEKMTHEIFNKEYCPKQPLTLEIINNYNKLMAYIKANLKPEDQTKTLDMFKEAVRRAGAYVPDNI